MHSMVILETSIFTRIINSLLSDDEYRELQNHLVDMPSSGDIIQGSGGIRKVRWGISGKSKRGGARVIYYWANNENKIFMLYAYSKNKKVDLTKDQLYTLRKVVVLEFENER